MTVAENSCSSNACKVPGKRKREGRRGSHNQIRVHTSLPYSPCQYIWSPSLSVSKGSVQVQSKVTEWEGSYTLRERTAAFFVGEKKVPKTFETQFPSLLLLNCQAGFHSLVIKLHNNHRFVSTYSPLIEFSESHEQLH